MHSLGQMKKYTLIFFSIILDFSLTIILHIIENLMKQLTLSQYPNDIIL